MKTKKNKKKKKKKCLSFVLFFLNINRWMIEQYFDASLK